MKKTILFWVTIFTLAYLLNSCGARKSESQKKSGTTKTDFSGFFRNSGNSLEFLNTDLNLKSNYNSNIDLNVDTETDEFTVEPSDPSKPAVYTDPKGNKHSLENAKLTNKKTKENTKEKSEKSGKFEKVRKTDFQKQTGDTTVVQVNGNSEDTLSYNNNARSREGWSLWNLLWLLIPVAILILTVVLIKKFKKKIPVS